MITQLIQPTPSRSSTSILDLTLVTFSLLCAGWAGLANEAIGALGLLIVAILAAAGSTTRFSPSARIVAWIGAGFSTLLAVQLPPIWPLAQILFGLPALVAIYRIPKLNMARTWIARGRLQWLPIIVMGGSSIVALISWVILLNPDIGRATALLPDVSLPLLILGAIGFSFINALIEEVVYRGILQGALSSLFGPGFLAILLQAIIFGTSHYHGFPSGIVGATLAGTWALTLGWARQRTSGLLTPLIAHIAADATIFGIVAFMK